jgi:hypothetical protein
VFNLYRTNNQTGIIKIGKYANGYNGETLHIKIYYHNGFGSSNNQQDNIINVYFKWGNGGNTCNSYYNYITEDLTPKWYLSSSNEAVLYIQGTYYNDNSYYEINYSENSTWTNEPGLISNFLSTGLLNTPSLYNPIVNPTITNGTCTTPSTNDNSTLICTTNYVQNNLIPINNNITTNTNNITTNTNNITTNTNNITTNTNSINTINTKINSYPPFNTPVYNELIGLTGVSSLSASYSSTNDIWGYAPVVSGSKSRGCLTNYITEGYNSSNYGWGGGGSAWFAPYTAKYMICCTFYITSNFKENIFSLIKYNSSNTKIYSQNILANGFNISTYTVNTFTTILPMAQGDYFRIEMSFYSNPCVMYFDGTTYSSMKVMLIG